jgi:small-conductance mechanosensitive channel
MIIKKLSFAFIILFSFTCLTMSTVGHCDQTVEVEDLTAKRTNFLNDIEKILGSHGQDIAHLESNISILKEELKALNVAREKLIEDKAEGAVLELVTKQKGVIEDRINTLNETVRVRTEITDIAGALGKALEVTPTLTKRKSKISEEAALLPASQFESIQKETELLKARLEAILALVKEKETYLSTSKTSLDASKIKPEEEKKKLKDKLKALTIQKPSTQEESYRIENMRRSLESEIKLQDEKVNLLLIQTKLASLNLQSVEIQKLNKQLEIDVNAGIAGILSNKFKEAEAQRKAKEAEEAKKAEEERRRIAEEAKAKADLEKKEALKKEEIAVQKQLEETSPERKRVLEVEADVHKQQGLIATMKDELITVGNERHKDRVEFKRIQKDIEEILGGENTPDEIAAELDAIGVESQRIQDKIKAVQSLLTAVEKQKSIVSESLKNIRAELLPTVPGEKPIIEKEAEGFSDSALGKQLIKLVNLRVKHIEEQSNLVETKIERLSERLELNKVLSERLTDAQKTLSQIRAANVWARRESGISTNTVIEGLSDIKILKNKPVDFYKASVQNFKKLGVYLSDKKNIPAFVVKLFITIVVILLVYFVRRYLKRRAREEIQIFTAITPQTFFTYELIPGLFRIMQHTLTMFFLFVIALTISLTIPTNAPVILSAIYGFAIISVYKFLRSTVSESFSPYTGERRWVPVTYSSARHIFKGLNAILLFSAITITIIFVLNAYSYKKDVIELLWFIYRIVTLFLVIWIAVGQRSYLLRILPYPESAIGKLVNKIINLLYPLFIAFVILLFAIRSLGYVLLMYTLMATLIKNMFVAVIAYLVYRYILRQQLLSQEKRLNQLKSIETKELESEENKIKNRFRVYKYLLDYGTVIISVVVILGIWNDTFRDVVNSPAAPTLFRNIYENVLYVFVSIKNGLTHKFTLAEGRYTTPFKMLIGILVLVGAFICARYFKNLLQTKVYEKAQLEEGAKQAISSGVKYFTIGIAAVIGLNVAGIPLRSLTIFAGAFGIGIGFGMQNIINNLVSGIIIIFEKPIKIGDIIKIDADIAGKVESINIRSTTIKTFERTTVIIPNSRFLESNVINWIHGGDMVLRAIITVGVAYGSDTELVRECLLKVVNEHPHVLKDPEPKVRFAEFAESSLNFQLYFWAHIDNRWMAISDLNFAIDRIFRENNITIPFPQRDLHIRTEKTVGTKFPPLIDKERI